MSDHELRELKREEPPLPPSDQTVVANAPATPTSAAADSMPPPLPKDDKVGGVAAAAATDSTEATATSTLAVATTASSSSTSSISTSKKLRQSSLTNSKEDALRKDGVDMRNSDGTKKHKKKKGGASSRRKHLQHTEFSKRLETSKRQSGLTLTWHDVSYEVEVKNRRGASDDGGDKKKLILDQVSGVARAGHFLAIMGASGAGKTSLMSVLSGRVSLGKGASLRGVMRLNEAPFSMSMLKKCSAFVEQDDLFLPYLTIRETLRVAAKLRLPSTTTEEERSALVESIIDELALIEAADTVVGGPKVKGISGGERKRLAIAVALLTDPTILFLDEPTSGLDAMSALNVVETLNALADNGRTVIATIHQPRSQVFALFDTLIVLSKGCVAYFGDAGDECIAYFSTLGHVCPTHTNPADFLLDVCSVDLRGEAMAVETGARVDSILNAFAGSDVARHLSLVKPDADDVVALKTVLEHKVHQAGKIRQFSVLLVRAWQNLIRDKARTVARVIQAIVVGILVSLIFFQLGDDQSSIQDRSGALFFILLNQSFGGLFQILNTFVAERSIFQRERAANMYHTGPYYWSKMLAELPMSFVPIVFGAIIYYIVGFNPKAEAFVVFLAALYMVSMTSESLGFCLAALSPSVEVAMGISPLILIFFVIFGGFYISLDNVPVWWLWFRYLSFIGYGYEILMVNEFEGRTLTCTTEQLRSVPGTNSTLCPFVSGEQVIEHFDMRSDNTVRNFAILVVMVVGYRLLAYFALRFLYRGFTGHNLADAAKKKDV